LHDAGHFNALGPATRRHAIQQMIPPSRQRPQPTVPPLGRRPASGADTSNTSVRSDRHEPLRHHTHIKEPSFLVLDGIL
jgi:hypothetical protein